MKLKPYTKFVIALIIFSWIFMAWFVMNYDYPTQRTSPPQNHMKEPQGGMY